MDFAATLKRCSYVRLQLPIVALICDLPVELVSFFLKFAGRNGWLLFYMLECVRDRSGTIISSIEDFDDWRVLHQSICIFSPFCLWRAVQLFYYDGKWLLIHAFSGCWQMYRNAVMDANGGSVEDSYEEYGVGLHKRRRWYHTIRTQMAPPCAWQSI